MSKDSIEARGQEGDWRGKRETTTRFAMRGMAPAGVAVIVEGP